MDSLRYLLATLVALTLVMSSVSTINPSYFAGLNAFADEEEDDDEDRLTESLGEHSKAELEIDDGEVELKVEIEDGDLDDGLYDIAFACESLPLDEEFQDALEVADNEGDFETDLSLPSGTYSGCEIEVGGLTAAFTSFNIMADDEDEDEDEHEEDDDNNEKNDEDDEDEHKITKSLGESSEVVLEVEDDAELQIEIEDGDLEDGTYDVVFACDIPDIDEEFADGLEVEDGEGRFKEDLPLTDGTYSGCEVEVGGLSTKFESFTIVANEDDDEHEEDDEDDHENELKREFKLKAEEDGVEIEVEVEGISMEDGLYDAVFVCDSHAFSITLKDAFKVEDGEGKLEETIELAHDSYSGCEIAVAGTTVASFKPFTLSEESEDEQKQKIEEKRKEKKERIISSINGKSIHERHINQNAASPGDYQPGWDYTLKAPGSATNDTATAEADINVNLAIWKSNSAVILLDVIDGTVVIEDQTYTVVLGFALYSTQHDVFRVGALAVDDDGNIYKLKLRGNAVGDNAEFPAESESIELEFEGNNGSVSRFGDWKLDLDGTIMAG